MSENNMEQSGYFTKSYNWFVGDTVIMKRNKFNFTKGKEYVIFNDTWIEDMFVVEDDVGRMRDASDNLFYLKKDCS